MPMDRLYFLIAFFLTLTLSAYEQPCLGQSSVDKPYPRLGSVQRHDPAADEVLLPDAQMEILAEGFKFSEGPVWMPEGQFLLFTDIPRNTVFRWDEKTGLSIYLRPSGYVGTTPRGGEPGANGLARDRQGRLISMEHGERRVTRLDDPQRAIKTVLADRFQGKRLNSPNDGVVHSNGDIYFTDPPYGLEDLDDDPAKELDFQGVYRLTPDGKLSLLTRGAKTSQRHRPVARRKDAVCRQFRSRPRPLDGVQRARRWKLGQGARVLPSDQGISCRGKRD